MTIPQLKVRAHDGRKERMRFAGANSGAYSVVAILAAYVDHRRKVIAATVMSILGW